MKYSVKFRFITWNFFADDAIQRLFTAKSIGIVLSLDFTGCIDYVKLGMY